MKKGYRDGNLDNTLFNGPVSLKIFRYDKVKAQQERNKVMIILKDDSIECQYATYLNYTQCMDTSEDDDIIEPSRIKEIYTPFDENKITEQDLALEALSEKVIIHHISQ